MAEISVNRATYEKLKSGDFVKTGGEERVASFLANKFEEGEKEQRKLAGNNADWQYAIWTYRF